jgi:hypothetical protein
VTTFRDPRETAERIERESAGRQPSAAEHPAAGHPAARLRPARTVTRSAGTAPPPGQPRPR